MEENDDWVIDWNTDERQKYFIYYNWNCKELDIDYSWQNKISLFYFSSKEIAEKAIKELKEEFLFLLRDY
jgi:hypothetical protein